MWHKTLKNFQNVIDFPINVTLPANYTFRIYITIKIPLQPFWGVTLSKNLLPACIKSTIKPTFPPNIWWARNMHPLSQKASGLLPRNSVELDDADFVLPSRSFSHLDKGHVCKGALSPAHSPSPAQTSTPRPCQASLCLLQLPNDFPVPSPPALAASAVAGCEEEKEISVFTKISCFSVRGPALPCSLWDPGLCCLKCCSAAPRRAGHPPTPSPQCHPLLSEANCCKQSTQQL